MVTDLSRKQSGESRGYTLATSAPDMKASEHESPSRDSESDDFKLRRGRVSCSNSEMPERLSTPIKNYVLITMMLPWCFNNFVLLLCYKQAAGSAGFQAVGRQFEPYGSDLWLPCGVTRDVVPGQSW